LSRSESESDPEVVGQILSYFVCNPNAADSLEGVARWRLLEECAHRNFQQTTAALNWLVSRGFLEEVRITGSSRIFRLDPAKREEAVRFLAKRGDEPGQAQS
jgi:hypothetical protein